MHLLLQQAIASNICSQSVLRHHSHAFSLQLPLAALSQVCGRPFLNAFLLPERQK